jgi:hypothetical protein
VRHCRVIGTREGDEARQRLFLGVRRFSGATSSTMDEIEHVSSAFQTNLSGLMFADSQMANAPDDLDDLPCFAVMTGISSRTHGAEVLPSLETALRAARGARFQVSVVAEPLDADELQQAVDGLHQIESEMYRPVEIRADTFAKEIRKLPDDNKRHQTRGRAWRHCMAVVLGGDQPSRGVNDLITKLLSID